MVVMIARVGGVHVGLLVFGVIVVIGVDVLVCVVVRVLLKWLCAVFVLLRHHLSCLGVRSIVAFIECWCFGCCVCFVLVWIFVVCLFDGVFARRCCYVCSLCYCCGRYDSSCWWFYCCCVRYSCYGCLWCRRSCSRSCVCIVEVIVSGVRVVALPSKLYMYSKYSCFACVLVFVGVVFAFRLLCLFMCVCLMACSLVVVIGVLVFFGGDVLVVTIALVGDLVFSEFFVSLLLLVSPFLFVFFVLVLLE